MFPDKFEGQQLVEPQREGQPDGIADGGAPCSGTAKALTQAAAGEFEVHQPDRVANGFLPYSSVLKFVLTSSRDSSMLTLNASASQTEPPVEMHSAVQQAISPGRTSPWPSRTRKSEGCQTNSKTAIHSVRASHTLPSMEACPTTA